MALLTNSTPHVRMGKLRQEGRKEGPCPGSKGGHWCFGNLCSHFSIPSLAPPLVTTYLVLLAKHR